MHGFSPEQNQKKDVNVNTLFPVALLRQLDEWAWSKRMTRSAALRALVEMAFETLEDSALNLPGGSDDGSVESLHRRIDRLEIALDGLRKEMDGQRLLAKA